MTLIDVFSYHNVLDGDVPSKPWRLGSWLWATQGHMLVAFADDGSPADATPEKYLKAEHYLTAPPSDVQPVSLSALRTFAGDVIATDTPCDRCHGSGREDEYDLPVICEHCGQITRAECRECGGDGKAGLHTRMGRVLGQCFNLTLLAFALSQVPAEDAASMGTVAALRGRDLALVIVGGSWRLVLMAMKDGGESMPAFLNERSESATSVAAVDPVDGVVAG